jgi:hypothetical protein
MIQGGIEAGPNAVLALSQEKAIKKQISNFPDALDALTYSWIVEIWI